MMACTGTIVRGQECLADANQPPQAPTIEGPISGLVGITTAQMVVSTSPFVDPDAGDTHAVSEFEIWVAAAGTPLARAWHATIADPARLTQVTLADGEFDDARSDLDPWTDYIIRARYGDSSGSCTSWSEWSQASRFRSDDGSNYFFDPTRTLTFELDIPQASYDAINAEARPPGCVPYERNSYPGTLRFEGEVFENVGIRVKGGCGSARRLDNKAALKIHLDWDDPSVDGCPVERRIHGLDRLTFNNMVQDPTYMHETMAYELYKRMGVPTPRTNYVRLYINGMYRGFYLNVESLDRRFVARRFQSKEGMMYEGTYFCDLIPSKIPPDTTGTYCFSRKFGTGTCSEPSDFQLLAELIQAIDALPAGQFYPEVEKFFEFDTFLSQWALESVLDHWDAYEFSIINNYRVYYDPATTRWTMLPTGVDQTFGNRGQSPFAVSGILATRCLSEPDCEAAFAARLRQAVKVFEDANLVERINELRARISDQVMEDPRKEVTFDQYNAAVDAMVQWIPTRSAYIEQQLTNRGL